MSRRQRFPSAAHNQEEAFGATAATPSAPPDVPRVPPVRHHRQPHGLHPALIYDHPKFGTGYTSLPAEQPPFKHSAQPAEDEVMDPEGNYTTRREEHPVIAPQHIHDAIQRKANVAPRTLPGALATASQQPQPLSGQIERRNKFANDRSPLQRLELTLDSMTKEEKRARVQAAEQRARERAAKKAAEASANHSQPGDAQNRHLSSQRQTQYPASIAQYPALSRNDSSRSQSDRRQQPYLQHQTQLQSGPQQALFRHKVVELGHAAASPPALLRREDDEEDLDQPRFNLPRRNLSFRERTARNELEPQAEDKPLSDLPAAFFTGASTGGSPLTRNGSNMLRKESRTDQQDSQRAQSTGEIAAAAVPRSPAAHQPHAIAIAKDKDKELPPVPVSQQARRGISYRATEPVHETDHASDEENVPYKRHGEVPSAPVRHPDLEHVDVATARRRLERQDSDHSIESAPQHRISRLIFKDPEHLRPGEGLYKSPTWLNEYEKATVGSLGGNLLDLAESQPSGADKNKAWWEGGGRSNNSSYSSRPRKAEAFDGEYDDTDGM